MLTVKSIQLLNADPYAVAENLSVSDLVSVLKEADTAYHNASIGRKRPSLTDRAYDVLKDELTQRKPDHPYLKKIGADVQSGRIPIPYFMPSLNKIKPENADEWLERHPGPYVLSRKLDGVSLLHVFGDSEKLYTRGNGTKGKDVTHLLPFLNVPHNLPKDTAVRLELTLSESAFVQFSKDFENARNLVSGLTTKKSSASHPAINHVKAIAHEMISPSMAPSSALAKLASYGYTVVKHVVVKTATAASLEKVLQSHKSRSPVLIDGMVVTQDKKYTRPKSGNPAYAVAFKMTSQEDIVQAEVVRVEWSISKYGKLKPVIILRALK